MKRRDVLKAGAVVPAVAAAQHHYAPQAAAKSTGWKPKTLSSAQNETVIALADTIIPATDTPGAKEAKVNEYIDLFLGNAPRGERERFMSGLKWFEEHSAKQLGTPFSKAAAGDRVKLLLALEEGGAGLEEGHQFFRLAKQLTSRIYYNTAIGFKEMNKGGRVPKTFGCQHLEHRA
jgi:hypothetical protein